MYLIFVMPGPLGWREDEEKPTTMTTVKGEKAVTADIDGKE